MNVFSEKNLLRSKWTSTSAFHDETHFLVTNLNHDLNGQLFSVTIQGQNNRHRYDIDWHELEDSSRWRFGWQ